MRRVNLSTLGKMGDNTDHPLKGRGKGSGKKALLSILSFFFIIKPCKERIPILKSLKRLLSIVPNVRLLSRSERSCSWSYLKGKSTSTFASIAHPLWV